MKRFLLGFLLLAPPAAAQQVSVGNTGDVRGPASSTTDNCVKFGDTTGKLLADAGTACGGSGGTPGGSTNDVQYKGPSGFAGLTLGVNEFPIGRSANSPISSGLSSLLDTVAGSSQGSVLYRSGSAWTALAPGTSGQILTTGGAGANPSWQTAAGGNVSNSGTPLNLQYAQWTDATHVKGRTLLETRGDLAIDAPAVAKNASGTLAATDHNIYLTSFASPITLTAPSLASTNDGNSIVIADTGGVVDNTHTVTFAPPGGATAIGATVLAGTYGQITCTRRDTVYLCNGALMNGAGGTIYAGQGTGSPPLPVTPTGDVTFSTDGAGTTSVDRINGYSVPRAINCGNGQSLVVTGWPGSTAWSCSGSTTSGSGDLVLGASGRVGSVTLGNATSGTQKWHPPTGALGTSDITFPGGTATLATLAGTETLSNKTVYTVASTTGGAGLRLPHGAAPTSPTDGDMWTTAAGGLYVRINGSTVGPLGTGGTGCTVASGSHYNPLVVNAATNGCDPDTLALLNDATLTLGAAGTQGKITLGGSSSGTMDIVGPTAASGTATLAAGTEVVQGGALGTPSSGTLTNTTGYKAANVVGGSSSPCTIVNNGSHTGDTTETVLAYCGIPANTLGSSGVISIKAAWMRNTSGTSNVQYNLRIGTANDASGTLCGAYSQGNIGTSSSGNRIDANLYADGATNSQVCEFANNNTGWTANSAQTYSIDSTANTIYVVMTGKLTNTGDSIRAEALIVKVESQASGL